MSEKGIYHSLAFNFSHIARVKNLQTTLLVIGLKQLASPLLLIGLKHVNRVNLKILNFEARTVKLEI